MKLIATIAITLVLGFIALEVIKPDNNEPGSTYVTAILQSGKLRDTVVSTGTVGAVTQVEVGSQLSGQIDQLLVDFNDVVKSNQPMARLDPQSYEASVSQARAALEVTRANKKVRQAVVDHAFSAIDAAEARTSIVGARIASTKASVKEAKQSLARKMNPQGARVAGVTEDALDQARAQLARSQADLNAALGEKLVHAQSIVMAQADLRKAEAELLNAEARIPEKQAALAVAEVNLDRTIIRSPIDGVVIGREVNKGQTVAASLEAPRLFTVAKDLHQMEVLTNVDEADIGKIKSGQTASFTVDAFPEEVFPGTVAQIRKTPATVQNVVAYIVVLSTDNPDLKLLPGMTATVEIIVTESEDVLKIPLAAMDFVPMDPSLKNTKQNTTLEGPGRSGRVWVLDKGGVLTSIPVLVGEDDGESAMFYDGTLGVDDVVIVNEIPNSPKKSFLGLRIGF